MERRAGRLPLALGRELSSDAKGNDALRLRQFLDCFLSVRDAGFVDLAPVAPDLGTVGRLVALAEILREVVPCPSGTLGKVALRARFQVVRVASYDLVPTLCDPCADLEQIGDRHPENERVIMSHTARLELENPHDGGRRVLPAKRLPEAIEVPLVFGGFLFLRDGLRTRIARIGQSRHEGLAKGSVRDLGKELFQPPLGVRGKFGNLASSRFLVIAERKVIRWNVGTHHTNEARAFPPFDPIRRPLRFLILGKR